MLISRHKLYVAMNETTTKQRWTKTNHILKYDVFLLTL